MGKLDGNNGMIRYHDVKVKIFSVNVSDINSYMDPFFDGGSGIEYPIIISRLIISSDASAGTLSCSLPDSDYSRYNNPHGDGFHSEEDEENNNSLPSVGYGIQVSVLTDGKSSSAYTVTSNAKKDGEYSVIFQGYISSISRNVGSSGVYYQIEAKDLKSRLNDQVIKKVYNASYKKSSTPIFKESGYDSNNKNPYTAQKLTIEEILQDIFRYAYKYGLGGANKDENIIGFKYSDFDFNGDNYLKGFIPPTIAFDNTTILESIYRLISSAGPYRMALAYPEGRPKIYFYRVDNKCNMCGPEITLRYGNKKSGTGSTIDYLPYSFNSVNVISDNTSRSINDSCSVLKAYSGQIEWYSGHFYIIRGSETNAIKNNAYLYGGNDTSMKVHRFSCKNWDGYNYYFGIKSIPRAGDNSISVPYVIVGAPLYPAWNPSGGYDAYQKKFTAAIKKNIDGKMTIIEGDLALNYGITENDRKYITHKNFLDTVGKGTYYNSIGFAYDAYVPFDVCVYCNGSGAVEDFSNSFSEFGNTRDINGNVINAPSVSPFNYRYSAVGNEPYSQNIGESATKPTRHPVPWKNTCPVCRGTGIEPWFKMTTICQTLIDVSPENTKLSEITDKTLAGKKDTDIAVDKTYSESIADLSYRYPVSVQVESDTAISAYEYENVEEEERFNHSLVDVKMEKENTMEQGNSNALIFKHKEDGTDDSIDKNFAMVSRLYYTQISAATGFSLDVDRGMVIFKKAQFIGCKKPMNVPIITSSMEADNDVSDSDSTIYECPTYDMLKKKWVYSLKGENGGNSIGQNVAGFWRPARAWITCYFKRDKFESFLTQKSLGNDNYVNTGSAYTMTRTTKGGDATDYDRYSVSPRIEDNMYCAEIMKTSKEDSDEVEEFKVRKVVRGMTIGDAKWQLHPWDFGKLPLPGVGSGSVCSFTVPFDYRNMWDTIYKRNVSANYFFPGGKLLSFEPLRDIEARSLSQEAVSEAMKHDVAGKVIAWIHKDDRIKMFEKSCAELERRNNVQISGTVVVRGEVPCFNDSKYGLGWVELYDGMKACVIKIELDMNNNFTMALEVGTEELRVGQKKEADLEYERLLSNEMSGLNLKGNPFLAQGLGGEDPTLGVVDYKGIYAVGGGAEK